MIFERSMPSVRMRAMAAVSMGSAGIVCDVQTV
jgi:hypothetical protein